MKKKDIKKIVTWLMYLSVVGVILAFVGYLGYDLWLASTQWLLVSAVLALFAIYAKISS